MLCILEGVILRYFRSFDKFLYSKTWIKQGIDETKIQECEMVCVFRQTTIWFGICTLEHDWQIKKNELLAYKEQNNIKLLISSQHPNHYKVDQNKNSKHYKGQSKIIGNGQATKQKDSL